MSFWSWLASWFVEAYDVVSKDPHVRRHLKALLNRLIQLVVNIVMRRHSAH